MKALAPDPAAAATSTVTVPARAGKVPAGSRVPADSRGPAPDRLPVAGQDSDRHVSGRRCEAKEARASKALGREKEARKARESETRQVSGRRCEAKEARASLSEALAREHDARQAREAPAGREEEVRQTREGSGRCEPQRRALSESVVDARVLPRRPGLGPRAAARPWARDSEFSPRWRVCRHAGSGPCQWTFEPTASE